MQEIMPGQPKGPLLPRSTSRFAQPVPWVSRGPRVRNSFDTLWEGGDIGSHTMTRHQWEQKYER